MSKRAQMIQLLIGPYRSGKTGRLLKQLVEYKREHPLDSCLILVPSQRYGSLLREQLVTLLTANRAGQNADAETFGGSVPHGIFGVRIATVYEACEQVVRNSGIAPLILPRELCTDVVADAVSAVSARGELTHLQSIAGMRGTASAVYKLIDEFERAAMSPSDVIRAVDATSSGHSRFHELASVYKEYWQRLDQLNATDQKRLAFTCREILTSGRHQSSWTEGSNAVRVLMVDGFDRISPLQAEVIHALSQHAAVTKISFDYVLPEDRDVALLSAPDEDEYAWKDSSYKELHSRFQVEPQIASRPENSANSAPIDITGFRAIERFFEAQEIARRCKSLLVDEKVKPEGVLVVARDISSYSDAIRISFGDAGIPFFIDESVEHTSLPLTKFLLGLLKLAMEELPRRAVMDCLRSPFFNLAGIGLNKTNVEALDRKSLDSGILGGRTAWQTFCDNSFNEELAIKFDAFMALVTPPSAGSPSDFARWVEDRIDLLRKPANARSADDLSGTASNAELEALSGLRTALNTLLLREQLLNRQTLSYPEFYAELESLIDSSSFRRQPATHETIYVCAAEHAPNRRFDMVLILGTVEGDFPKHSGDSGFLSADERARWSGYGVVLTNPREEPGFERALFKSLIDRARRSVVISAPCLDMSGDEIFPSFFLTDGTVNLPSFERVDVSRLGMKLPTSARESISTWLWHKPGVELADSMHEQAENVDYWSRVSTPLFGAWSRHQGPFATAYNGYLVDLTSSGWLSIKTPSAFSASALNNYGQCPFKYWLTNLLKVEPKDEPESGLTVQFKGSLFHRVLEIYYSRMVQIHPDERLLQKQAVLSAALSDAVADLEGEKKFHPSPYWQNEQKELLFRLNRFIEYDEARTTKDKEQPQAALFEARFGMPKGDTYPAVTIETSAGPVKVRGIIDRIDINADGIDSSGSGNMSVTVIDYKTGSSPISADDIAAFAQIQLPLYAMAVEQSILPGAKTTSGQYLSVNAAKSIGAVNFKQERWSTLIESAKDRVRQSVELIGQGDFSVKPYASKACKSCDHASVCRVADMKQLQFAEGD